ncbi:MAG: GNAT family N-acetyltransferase [Cyanobacteria bacterium P01_F01_bin.86]
MTFAVPGYHLRQGSGLDRPLLVKFLGKTYAELAGTQTFDHLAATVDQHLSPETPLWWVETENEPPHTIACLWLGNAIDQQHGKRQSYVLVLYVLPEHRRQGIATALLETAHDWSRGRGDRQIGLQVFADNAAAIALYRKLGYQTHSLWLTRSL